MIAVDTNVLVYSVQSDSPLHEVALSCVRDLAEGSDPWAIPWPCIHEFLALVTHRKIYNAPMPVADALEQVDAWMESPTLRILSETVSYFVHFRELVQASKATGSLIHDARIAAICLSNGVHELWTTDRDFSRFPAVRTRNPLIAH